MRDGAKWVLCLVLLPGLAAVWGCGRGEASARPDGESGAAGNGAHAAAGHGAPREFFQELPEGVTPEMVARGEALFRGNGFCYTCHGADGRGVPQLGSDLTDREWRHGDGSYESLVERIVIGVPAERSASGVPMPPRGGARLPDEDVRAVAAYVWVLSRVGS